MFWYAWFDFNFNTTCQILSRTDAAWIRLLGVLELGKPLHATQKGSQMLGQRLSQKLVAIGVTCLHGPKSRHSGNAKIQ